MSLRHLPLGFHAPLQRGLPPPRHRLHIVFAHAVAEAVTKAEPVLRIRDSLHGGLAVAAQIKFESKR